MASRSGPRRLDVNAPDFGTKLAELLQCDDEQDRRIDETVRTIISDVRTRGDRALLAHTNALDRRSVPDAGALEVPAGDRDRALASIDSSLRAAITTAAARIEEFHRYQLQHSWSYTDSFGNRLGQRLTPLQRVGVYVPGGIASYPSTALMNIIPARVAGVEDIIMTVPAPDDALNPAVLAAASLAGVSRVFTIGGAQAIAALAYGTETVPRVDKIVGPGNVYVAAAKRQVFGQVGMDMLAGPSEILVICDGATEPDWIALDLFSQAEHDENARAILLSPDRAFIDRVDSSIQRLLPTMPRHETIATALRRHGALIAVNDLDQAAEISNRIAPEHLELSVADPRALLDRVTHAGAVFLGRFSSEALGDYCVGSNHVLPTSATARFSSPLGVYDFVKRTSLIECSAGGATALADVAATLAESESLTAHARSALARKR